MMSSPRLFSWLIPAAILAVVMHFPLLASGSTSAAKKAPGPAKAKPASAAPKTPAAKPKAAPARRTTGRRPAPRKQQWSPWTTPTYAESTHGDLIDGDDLTVRRAAVEGLGPFNGSVVVVDPNNGRILTMVNQKLALSPGHQPCSTIKVPVAMAGLKEGLIERDTKVRVYQKATLDLTQALAVSNNTYFAWLGQKLGFEKVLDYCKRFGLGERASLIPEEQPGRLPGEPPPAAVGGVGKMTSFGEGISLSPLQLAALLGAISNGGTLYYLQYPRSQEEVHTFVPRVKRTLDIADHLDHVKPGMLGATEFGTARRAKLSYAESLLGKTGTCTEDRTHLGWFGSFNEIGDNSLVVVVLLTGGKPSVGPMAADIAGKIFKSLTESEYFLQTRTLSPATMVSAESCCTP